MSYKYNLSDLYISEWKMYNDLKLLGNSRTTTGNVSFTSSSSNTTYSSTTGQLGIMQQLEVLLTPFKINATDWNGIEEDIVSHKADIMPHKFVDNGRTYRYGLSVVNGILTMNYEEVL